MDLDNHKKHSFSNGRGRESQCPDDRNLSLQCFARTNGTKKNVQKCKMPKILLQIISEQVHEYWEGSKSGDVFIVGVNLVTVEFPSQTVNV